MLTRLGSGPRPVVRGAPRAACNEDRNEDPDRCPHVFWCYPVKFGSAFVALAAGAAPPPPASVVVVDSVVVVSVDVEPVDVEAVVSGVVVVIVVTAVLPPVVMVETIVVVAWAPKGAAPAVKAAVAAPSVIKTANPAPQRARASCTASSYPLLFLD